MKRSPLAVLLVICISFSGAFAQVGIGTASPNQKAVLELKSPGNNQGFLVPRLTTTERMGMTGLAASEKGLLVFDSDINKFYYWSGSAWIIIEDSTGTDSQTLSFNPTTGLLSITGGNGINLGGVTPGGSAGGDLTGTFPSPAVAANAITSAKILDGTIATNDLSDGSVTTAKVVDGTITNTDINASAAIAVTKVAPGTNGQVLVTSGTTPTWSNMPGPTGAAGGDLTGTYPNPSIASNAIISIKILDGAIITSKIADAAINTLKLLDGAVNSTKILDGSIATADIQDGAISTLKIADNGVTSTKILDGAITSAKVLDGTLATADVADGAITSTKVLDGAITSAKILDGTVATADILDATVATNDIANSAITNGKIADNAINSIKIADGTVATVDLLDGAITNAKVGTGIDISKLTAAPTTGFVLTTVLGNVTWAALPALGLGTVTNVATGAGLTGGPITTTGTISLADNGVTTIKVADDAITSAKLQDDAATDANRAVTTNHIRDGAITSGKILDGTIASADILDGTVSSTDITNGTIATADVADGAVTDLKIASGITFSKLSPSGTNGQVLTTVAGATTWANLPPSGTGTVTNIATGAGLTGGPVTTTGTISLADNGVTTIKVLDGAITSAKVLDGTLVTADLADGAISSLKVLDGTLATADLADGSVTSAKVLDGTIASADILDGTVSSTDILDGTVSSTDILDGTVSSTDITNGTIATADVADGAVTDLKIASGITFSKLSSSTTNGQVLTTVGGATTWADLPPSGTGTVTNIATGAGLTGGPVTTTGTISLADNGVTTIKVLDGAITSAKVLDGGLLTADLADGAVNSLKVLDGSIINADINPTANVAVTKLAAGATGDVLTTPASGIPTWQAPVDNSATNEIQDLSGVLTQGNNAGVQSAVNFSALSVNRADAPGALNVNGSHYMSFTALGAAVTTYTVGTNDYVIIGTASPNVITNVTLPDASVSIGRILILKGRSVGSVSAAGLQPVLSGTDTLDGSTNPPILTPVGTSMLSITILAISANEWITINRTHN